MFELLLDKCKGALLIRAKRRQKSYLIKNDIKKLVKSIKLEMFLEDKINRITPYFPYPRTKSSYSDEDLMFEIRKNYDVFFFYLKKLSPFKLSNIIFIFLIIRFYLQIDVFKYLSRLLSWEDIKKIGNPLPFISPSLAIILLLVALYFTSRSGLFRKAKNKIKVEEIENKIKFHKENRILLSSLLIDGYKNIEHMLQKRDLIISKVKEEKEQDELSMSFDFLHNLEGIDELDKFMKELESKNKDLFPFFLGIHHISFWKLHEVYNEIFSHHKNRVNTLNGVFLTKKFMETFVNNKYFVPKFEENLNEKLLSSVKTMIYIEKYLKIINNQINRPHSIYSFFAFITNKDK
ncbi:hypothetical protein ACSS6N_12145 [Peribacillus frigoritolerans]|uniref:hypothetical protein n=1 Tax=Peribacillus frigoritolerans TaxID=450367 RepID=UPI003F85FF00